MVADASLFQQFLRPPKSVAEFGAEMDEADSRRQGNALQRLQFQQAQAGMADDQAARQASIAAGGDQNALVRLLNQSGNYRAAQGVQKSMLDAQKTQSDIGLSTAHAANYGAQTAKTQADVKYEAADRHARNLFGVSTIEDVASYIDEGVKSGIFPAEAAQQSLQAAQQQGVQAWKAKALSGAVSTVDRFKADAEMERAKLQSDTSIKTTGMNNATSIQTNALTNQTSRANNAATVGEMARGHTLADKRAGEAHTSAQANAAQGRVPSGYRQNPDGSLAFIPGGPADPARTGELKLTEDQGKATGWLVQADQAFKNMKGAIERSPGAATPGLGEIVASPFGGVGRAAGNLMTGEERQRFKQGASSLGEALLRAATGAGVNKDEALQKAQELTPQVGDSEGVRKQKMDSIPLYIESLKVRAGPGAPKAAKIGGGAAPGMPDMSAIDAELARRAGKK